MTLSPFKTLLCSMLLMMLLSRIRCVHCCCLGHTRIYIFPYSEICDLIHRCDEQLIFSLWYLRWLDIPKSSFKWCWEICWNLPLPLQWCWMGCYMGLHFIYLSLCIDIPWTGHIVVRWFLFFHITVRFILLMSTCSFTVVRKYMTQSQKLTNCINWVIRKTKHYKIYNKVGI